MITTLERKTSRRDNNVSMSGMTERGPAEAINYVLQDAKYAHEAGRLDEADSLYRTVLERAPKHPEALLCLGVLCRERGDLAGSTTLLEHAVEVAADSALAWLELTRTQHDRAAWEDCAHAAGETLARDQNCIEAELMNATALFALHRFEPATNAIERVIQHLPDDAGINLFHARCLLAQKLHAEALIPARHAAALMPTSPDAQFVLGAALKRVGQNEASETALRECLKLTPEHHEALNDLADIYFSRGDTQSALGCLRQSHAAAPFNLDAISGLCFYTAFDPHSDATTLFDLNRSWSLRLAAAAEKVPLPAPAVARPDNRIRIAYLAYDLLDHVTSWFLEPVLSRHDHDRFHITGYYGNETTDDVTARLGSYVDSWQAVAKDTIAETMARIRRDDIDILVLASFFRGKDRRVLAYRAAPIQVGYHNRVASTGLDTVDYILTEEGSDPVGQVEEFYTEALVRLTNHNVYLPPPDAPVPMPPPCLENGYVTFGSFNNHAKIGNDVIAAWAQVLSAVPNSRLILRSSVHFNNLTTQTYFRKRFEAHGIKASQLEFQGMRATRSDHLIGIREADIVLDPFPCNGGTTSCEALWMGLPLVTMQADTYMGRQGSSYLAKLGLQDLIATNTNDYVNIARRLSEDKSRLSTLRTTLRPRVEAAMFNYSQHILELETAFAHMQSHLKSGGTPVPFAVRDQTIL